MNWNTAREESTGLEIWDALERGLLVYFFILAMLVLFRVLFIAGMTDYLSPQVTTEDVWLALVTGLRLSTQTTGLLTLGLVLPAELVGIVSPRGRQLAYESLTAVVLVVFSIAFVGRFPFYRQFHASYNQVLFNTFNDDVWALFVSLVQEFNLPLRLVGALLLAAVLWLLLCRLLAGASQLAELVHLLTRPARAVLALCCSGLVCLLGLLTVYGGSLGWETELTWENVGVTRDRLLNEAILDDAQAVYRGYTLNHRNLACNGLAFTVEDVRRLAAGLSAERVKKGMAQPVQPRDVNNLDAYLTREAQGEQLAEPSHVFLIVSESLANWPLLPEYKELHIADNLRELIASDETDYCEAMLPNGATTVSAVMGLVTGFADANLYLTTMPEAFTAPYPTASAPIMQRLGYEPYFWYAGPNTWECVEEFTLAQGYQHFVGRGSLGEAEGNVWGVDDKYFYQAVLQGVRNTGKSFHVLLNASNHSPYTLDLAKEGFPAEKVRAALPKEEQGNELLLRQLGHYWYADRELGKLVRALRSQHPDCLIAIVGDHADRYNVEKNPSLYRQLAVPFIITGKGIKKKMLPRSAAGSQIDIMPTVVELIAPEGFVYESLGEPLNRGSRRGVNYGYWITEEYISPADVPFQAQDFEGNAIEYKTGAPAMETYINRVWALSWWRAKHGPLLEAGG